MKISDQDKRILREIQRDASRSLGALSEETGVAQSTLWRRLQEFEASGLIRGRVAVLDADRAGCKLCVLASVSLHDHTEEAVAAAPVEPTTPYQEEGAETTAAEVAAALTNVDDATTTEYKEDDSSSAPPPQFFYRYFAF